MQREAVNLPNTVGVLLASIMVERAQIGELEAHLAKLEKQRGCRRAPFRHVAAVARQPTGWSSPLRLARVAALVRFAPGHAWRAAQSRSGAARPSDDGQDDEVCSPIPERSA